ncbi:MAG TPA: ABC transporter permease [Gemmatimonadaceae bacterium]|nr:ABC transporter permease [Gemmatimonadaceae bacterium]
MTRLDVALVALILRLFPRAFRDRFGDELLAAYQEQRDALATTRPRPGRAVRAHALRTMAGLLRSVAAVHAQGRRRRSSFASDHRPHGTTTMQHLAGDLRLTMRLLRKQPGFAAVAILTLALGIGANTAVFSVLNSVILAPLPYDEPRQLVRLYTTSAEHPERREFLTGPDILDVREQIAAFSSIGINYTYREQGADLTTRDGQPERIRVMPVSADYFATLRATPLIGRTFERAEEREGTRRVILSHALWTAIAGRDPGMIGRTIELNGETHEVIGVMRPTFQDVVTGDVNAWIPANLERTESNQRGNHYLTAIARLERGITLAQAQAQVDALMKRLAEEFPDSNADRLLRVVPLHEDVVGESASAVYVLMGASGLVLLIACLNVANLFITRAIAQSRDTAIRTALGAGRQRLIGQRLTESLVVAAVGGAVGSLVAWWGVKVLLAVSPTSLPRAESVGFDPRLLAFAIVVTAVTGLLFGAWPALRAARADPRDALHDGSRGNTGGRASRRARGALVASQVSVSLMLLVGAGVLIRSFIARQNVDLGFQSAEVATFEVHLPQARYAAPESRARFHDAYMSRLRTLPGVEAVAVTSWLPANGRYHVWGYGIRDAAGEREWLAAQVRVIDGDFLGAMRVPLIQGRSFAESDGLDTAGVALISHSLATRVYGASDPLGQRFRMSGRDFTVVGVTGNAAQDASGAETDVVYLTHDQFAANRNWALTYVVRTNGHPEQVIAPARNVLGELDRALVLHQPRTMDAVLARHRSRERFTMLLMGTFAAIALSLAAVGVYGVLSYAVTQRTHEMGVRMALGAHPSHIRSIVIRQGLVIAGVGMAAGLAGALALSQVLDSLAFGVSPRDPVVFVTVSLVLAAVVVLAAYVPARRATRVDPLESLRAG